MDMNEFEYESFFIESSENLGVVFDSYSKLAMETEHFLDKIEDAVNELNDNPDKAKINLKEDINSYKSAVSGKKEPKPIDIRRVKPLQNEVKKFRQKLGNMLTRLARIKDKVAYGGNFIRGIVKRPKVYGHDMNDEKYAATNNNIREVNRAIDWVEKALIDLFNLADQDLNILTIVDKIYAKNKIFESTTLPGGCYVSEDQADIAELLPGSGDKVDESSYAYNTMDKKTGTAPGYIKGNHNMASWGEDEGDSDSSGKSLDDYRHPNSDGEDDIPSHPAKRKSVTSSIEDDSDDEEHPSSSATKASGPVNYYYYTYQNSLNKNSDSFNKYRNDDHSVGKHINSHNGTDKDDPSEAEDDYHTIGTESSKPWELNIFPKMISESTITEDVGDVDDDKPQGDHPVRDAMIDADRKLQTKYQQVKQTAQAGQQLYRAATRPIRRGKEWIDKEIAKWKDADETEIKERLADPNARKNIFHAIKVAIDNGSYLKAGILLNPIILALHFLKHKWFGHDAERIRNEMILELQREMEIIDEKIKDADHQGDNKAKYQLMRFKTEVQKKLWRVSGGKGKVSKFL